MVTDTYTLINAIKKMYPVVTFFKDRYFPDGRVYYSSRALIESKKGGRKVAPFVSPVVNGIVMDSEGYRTDEVDAPTIAPKKAITKKSLENKAFGEDPRSGRSDASRENELEAEYMDEMRSAILRRHELMCIDIITTGGTIMKHYSSAEDAANDRNAEVLQLRFYDDKFGNLYDKIPEDFLEKPASEKLETLYDITAELRRRGVHCTDLVMSSDVSKKLMVDKDFLDYFDLKNVSTGKIDQVETPDGVVCNGTINVGGTNLTLFTYDESFEDVDGQIKPFLPSGTMAFLHPGMGTTVYAAVSFVRNGSFESHAEKIVPRLIADENNNVIELHEYSRPVPYPLDWDGWLVARVTVPKDAKKSGLSGDGSGDQNSSSGNGMDDQTDTGSGIDPQSDVPEDDPQLKTETEINKLTSKAAVIEYGVSIGMTELSSDSSLADLKTAVINYQQENYAE